MRRVFVQCTVGKFCSRTLSVIRDASLSLPGHAHGPAAPVEDPAAAQSPGGAVGTSYRQRQQSRSHRRQLAKRNAATAASFLR